MPRFPLIPTLIVGLAIAAMVALGVWQLDRRDEKHAALAQYAANPGKPVIAFPSPPVGDATLFRRARADCLKPVAWRKQAGRAAGGMKGWRHIAECSTGAEGTALLVDVGVTADPNFQPQWRGGAVTGTITYAPNHTPLIASLFGDTAPKTLMLISDSAAPGLEPSAKPDLESVPNNHLAYAVQWFLFAGVAAIIYVLALRLREKRVRAVGQDLIQP